jgi:hypothetical protein
MRIPAAGYEIKVTSCRIYGVFLKTFPPQVAGLRGGNEKIVFIPLNAWIGFKKASEATREK